eukprot:3082349-Rhodomonas_salina.1
MVITHPDALTLFDQAEEVIIEPRDAPSRPKETRDRLRGDVDIVCDGKQVLVQIPIDEYNDVAKSNSVTASLRIVGCKLWRAIGLERDQASGPYFLDEITFDD